ncbi:PREDICTED: protein SHOOT GRAVITROPISM 5-like [Tarenaya hassleriana]|uniref:protein SHOOT GRAVITROPISM 5-like n=1 Tax=Tarenaya hassleriana TaxID=28532 RepID=UPI00053C24B3|nr:PREDICTED: protein SHOOT GRAVITROPISM 5-like [Tarenaya hassleriana]
MAEDDQKELQLLPSPPPSDPAGGKMKPTSVQITGSSAVRHHDLDLKLSISLGPFTADHPYGVEAVHWQAAEQIRHAAMEKAYAERIRELTRREMELAQSEFTRARQIWERTRKEVEKAERLKEKAMMKIDPACMEITCLSCSQRFHYALI